MTNTNYIIGIIVILVIGAGIFFMVGNKNAQPVNDTQTISENYSTSTETTVTETATTTTNNEPKQEKKMKATYTVKMETNKGTITLELNTNIAPKTVENFIKLAGSGFYDGVKFHRVIKDFMIQAGDPQSKDDKLVEMWGTGGPGYKFEDEIFDAATYKNGYKRGILAMANSGPNTNGSQFFIMHKDVPLPPNYTIFGHVTAGLETVDAIAAVDTGANDRPAQPVIITKVSVQ